MPSTCLIYCFALILYILPYKVSGQKAIDISCTNLTANYNTYLRAFYSKNHYYLLDFQSAMLHKLDSTGKCNRHTVVMQNSVSPLQPHDFYVSENFLFVRNTGFVAQFDTALNLVNRNILHTIVEDSIWLLFGRFSYPGFVVDEKANNIITSFTKYNSEFKPYNNQELSPWFYQNPVFALYKDVLKPPQDSNLRYYPHSYFGTESIFGREKWKGGAAHLFERHLYFNHRTQLLYVSERCNPEMMVYSAVTGKLHSTFGQKGTYLTENDTFHYISKYSTSEKSFYEIETLKSEHRIKSPAYLQVFHHAESNYTYRVYQKPAAHIEKYHKDSVLFYMQNVSKFLQVYNGEKLIYDKAIPAAWNLVSAEGDRVTFLQNQGNADQPRALYIMDLNEDVVLLNKPKESGVATPIEENHSAFSDDIKNLDAAVEKAQEENKKIFIYFTATWCGPCHNFQKTTLSNKNIVQYLSDSLITMKIDVDSNKALTRKFKIRGMPTCLVLDKEGRELNRKEGGMSVEALMKFVLGEGRE